MPPSNVVPALTTFGAESLTVPLLAGHVPVGMAAAFTLTVEAVSARVAARASVTMEKDLTIVVGWVGVVVGRVVL